MTTLGLSNLFQEKAKIVSSLPPIDFFTNTVDVIEPCQERQACPAIIPLKELPKPPKSQRFFANSVDYSGNTESRAGCSSDDNNPACKKGMHRSLQAYSPEGQDHPWHYRILQ